MKKNIFIILFLFVFSIQCSTINKNNFPESEVLTRKEIIKLSLVEIEKKYGEEILEKNIGIYKKGYSDWKVILYGKQGYYRVMVKENGEIILSEKNDYIK